MEATDSTAARVLLLASGDKFTPYHAEGSAGLHKRPAEPSFPSSTAYAARLHPELPPHSQESVAFARTACSGNYYNTLDEGASAKTAPSMRNSASSCLPLKMPVDDQIGEIVPRLAIELTRAGDKSNDRLLGIVPDAVDGKLGLELLLLIVDNKDG